MHKTVVGVVIVFFSLSALAQDAVSIIETDAEATIDSVPSYAEFTFSKTSTAATLSDAVTEALQLEPRLREQMEENELTPKEMKFSSVTIPKADGQQANTSARVRFVAQPYSVNDDGVLQFAQLCQTLVKVAAAAGATLEGPAFGVDNPSPVEQSAVTRAIEMAYPLAEAAATIMRGQILAVDKVTVLSTEWGKPSDDSSMQPDVGRIVCKAKVRVSYAFGPTTP